ncbi:SMP-30/gluconolactonase/LRE family protein [Larkinella sp. VNQ87]|uniref:SMP-30/gluconolactonase/LRE family protein n=1 Tax=Larkinella sp. VNQ87 TaxID=3400921 RepID=UPI003C01D9B6
MSLHRKTGLIFGALLALANSDSFAHSFFRADSVKVTAPGAAPKQISNQFKFTEGPAVNKKGDIYFTDQPNDKIWKYDTDGKLSVYMEKTGRSNGLYFDKKGNLIACADEKDELWSISPKGKVTVLLNDFEGKRLNGPNDLWIDPKGGIYFTDPYYQRDYWERKKPDLDGQKVYYLPKGKKEAVVVDGNLLQPNGIVGSPDGKYLFVADIRDNKTYKYEINADGSLTNRQLFVPQGSDGITLDEQGNLYLSGRGVTVYNAQGEKIQHIPVPSRWVGNLCFGGKNRKTLFITASESVYTLEMQVKGVE